MALLDQEATYDQLFHPVTGNAQRFCNAAGGNAALLGGSEAVGVISIEVVKCSQGAGRCGKLPEGKRRILLSGAASFCWQGVNRVPSSIWLLDRQSRCALGTFAGYPEADALW